MTPIKVAFDRHIKLLQFLHDEIEEMKVLYKELGDDGLREQVACRAYYRSCFGAFESIIYSLKRIALVLAEQKGSDPGLILALKDKQIDIVKGEVCTKTLKHGLKGSFSFVVVQLSRLLGEEMDVDYSGSGGSAFLRAIKVRDRLMHPKSVDCFEIEADDLIDIQNALEWFHETTNSSMKALDPIES